MPDTIFGLPLHPFAVHVPVVLVPLLALAIAGYVLVPKVRRQLGWVLIALAVAAVPAVYVARESGERLAAENLARLSGTPDARRQAAKAIDNHSQYADILIWLVVVAAILVLVYTAIVSGRLAALATSRSWDGVAAWAGGGGGRARTVVVIVSGVVLLGLAVAMAYVVIRAGHTGATMAWGQ
ncbi:MAG TPA: hypothetical protein VE172_00755 [Stackebrandtia sp.]|jgi:phosphoglycerol transferase MdoB-like AlkP superfamily enzyme|uniref:hypothetical protein n=1 Tax=Stackebrandtia sp. TaxID=2023065 RepID=UPI002D57553F|nr:hypothetical protein [Stackebrandtia sp.]HZE37319.1 hypothetical protein [Stackebrandtia sp.]